MSETISCLAVGLIVGCLLSWPVSCSVPAAPPSAPTVTDPAITSLDACRKLCWPDGYQCEVTHPIGNTMGGRCTCVGTGRVNLEQE